MIVIAFSEPFTFRGPSEHISLVSAYQTSADVEYNQTKPFANK